VGESSARPCTTTCGGIAVARALLDKHRERSYTVAFGIPHARIRRPIGSYLAPFYLARCGGRGGVNGMQFCFIRGLGLSQEAIVMSIPESASSRSEPWLASGNWLRIGPDPHALVSVTIVTIVIGRFFAVDL